MVGQAVSHYRILSKLGSGGMGVVYEAEDTHLGRRVALKFLPPELAGDSQALERFQREARAASALNHPSICTVYAIEQHERQHFIAMELLEGQSLVELVNSRPVPIAEVVAIGIQVADALESAHARGIVHRDIKPGNIFVTARKQVKILDFGLAKMDGLRLKTAAAQEETVNPGAGEITHPGMALGTISYMSPEQARGQLTDARSDLFSLGTVLYQLATGILPFQGDTSAVVFEAILNRAPQSPMQIDPKLPAAFTRIVEKALEKDRDLRYQTATDFKTDLARLKRDLESGQQPAAESNGKTQSNSIAVLYFQNMSGVEDDEYFRDGITEDIITELSKIKGLNVFSRATVLAYRDKQITPAQIGQQLRVDSVLTGTVRRAGNRLRISAQLVNTHTDFQVWSERYDRELQDVFEVQDEIATKIASALRVTLTPQEQEAIASKPTDNLQAYDLYLRGKSYARRYTRQDLEFALQMYENAVKLDPNFALAYAAMANVYAYHHLSHGRDPVWMQRAVLASRQASALRPDLPEVQVGNAWVLYADKRYDEAVAIVRIALDRKKDTEGAYYLLGRALFAAGRYQEIANVAETALEFAGNDYNIYTPIMNALSALGKADMLRNIRLRRITALEAHLTQVPEDARARIHLAIMYAAMERADDAMREASIATALRSNDATVLYNAACLYCTLKRKPEAMDALRRAHAVGFKDADWARRDPDLEILRDEPEFDVLYPQVAGAAGM